MMLRCEKHVYCVTSSNNSSFKTDASRILLTDMLDQFLLSNNNNEKTHEIFGAAKKW